VQIDSYYGEDEPAAKAEVRVYRPNDEQIGPAGVMDEKGVYVFTYTKAEDLKVSISHEGHRKWLTIPAKELSDAPPGLPQPQTAVPVDRTAESPLPGILGGLGFIFGLAAFFLSVRNAARLRELQQKTASPETANPPPADTPRPATLPTGPTPG
jgi:hypothetical protein